MTDSEAFKEGTDFLKYNKKIKFVDLATSLGVSKYDIDNIRRGQTQPNPLIIEKLIDLYPEVKKYFDKKSVEIVNDPGSPEYEKKGMSYETLDTMVKFLEETVERQKEEIAFYRKRIEAMEKERGINSEKEKEKQADSKK